MPGTRDSMSRSMANLDFDPEQGKRRARAQRSKRDAMGQSCSAFHFVLDKTEMGQAGEEAVKNNIRRSNSRDRGTADSNRPSYSDLVMDVTSKTAVTTSTKSAPLDAQAGSPTSVMAEEEKRRSSDNTRVSNDSTTISSTSPGSDSKEAAKESDKRHARTIPSNNDFRNDFRTRNRVTRTRSSHDPSTTTSSNHDPLAPGSRARRNRKSSRDPKSSRSMHMSMDGGFIDPSELMSSKNTTATDAFLKSPRRNLSGSPHRSLSKSPLRSVSKSPSRKKANMERFSRSFSGFDDWDPKKDLDDVAALTSTPTRRRGKKPAAKLTDDSDNHNHNSLSNLENSLSELPLSNDSAMKNDSNNSQDPSDVAVVEKKNRRKSFHEKNVHGSKPPATRKNSRQPRNNGGRFAQSFSCFDASPHDLVNASGSPTPIVSSTGAVSGDGDVASRPRIMDPEEFLAKEATIEVEKQKVSSLEEFQQSWSGDMDGQILFDDESPATATTSKPPTTRRAPRSKREPTRGVSRRGSSSGPRLRRSKTDDGSGMKTARSNHESGSRRRGSRDPEMQKQGDSSPEAAPRRQRRASYAVRSSSRDKRKPRVENSAENPSDGVRRGTSRDRKNRRSSVSVVDVEGDDSPPQRRIPRRARSSDGSTLRPMRDRSSGTADHPSVRRSQGVRRTKSSDGSVKPSSSMHKSLAMVTREASGGRRGDRSVGSRADRSTGTTSTSSHEDSSKSGGSSPPAPRRKTPQRSKSHGANVVANARDASQERGDSGTTMDDRASKRRSSVAAVSRAERRAMAHHILLD